MRNLSNAAVIRLFTLQGMCPEGREWVRVNGGDLKQLIAQCPDETWLWWGLVSTDEVTHELFDTINKWYNALFDERDAELKVILDNADPSPSLKAWLKDTDAEYRRKAFRDYLVSLIEG